jgi:hypothetical protein
MPIHPNRWLWPCGRRRCHLRPGSRSLNPNYAFRPWSATDRSMDVRAFSGDAVPKGCWCRAANHSLNDLAHWDGKRAGSMSTSRCGEACIATMSASPVRSPLSRRNSSTEITTTSSRPWTVTRCGPSLRTRRTNSLKASLCIPQQPATRLYDAWAVAGFRRFRVWRFCNSGHADQNNT